MNLKCPLCSIDEFFYTQQVTEYWRTEGFADEDGNVELKCEDCVNVSGDSVQEFVCLECSSKFDLKGNKKE